MAGYSGTPLAKKLGIKENSSVCVINEPKAFREELEPLPAQVKLAGERGEPLDLILLFVLSRTELRASLRRLASDLQPAGMLWVAWPKKSSKVATDLTENIIRDEGLEAGLVDTKVCAISDIWSGLKFVYRLKDRPKVSRNR
jgi:hypothetical protein